MQQSTNFDWISDILLTLISISIDKVDNVQEKNSNTLPGILLTVCTEENLTGQLEII